MVHHNLHLTLPVEVLFSASWSSEKSAPTKIQLAQDEPPNCLPTTRRVAPALFRREASNVECVESLVLVDKNTWCDLQSEVVVVLYLSQNSKDNPNYYSNHKIRQPLAVTTSPTWSEEQTQRFAQLVVKDNTRIKRR